MYFHQKVAWPPATYDVISRNHSNWPSLNLSQNVREGWTNSYWKRQVLMFYPLGKKLGKTVVGWHPAPHPLVRPRVKRILTVKKWWQSWCKNLLNLNVPYHFSFFLPSFLTYLLACLLTYIYITFTYIITYLFTYLLGGSSSGQTTLSCKDIYDADSWVKHT